MKGSKDLTKGNIIRGLFGLAMPIIATNFIQIAYSMIDMIWVGKLGSNAVAAVGTASFFINLALALFALVVTGSGINIAQSMGAKKEEDVKIYINNGFIMSFILAMIYSGIVIIFRKNIIGFFDLGNYDVEKMAMQYLIISAIGILFMYFNALFVSIFNSLGNSKMPFKINTIGFILNVILDPILIFGWLGLPRLGVLGAALASLIARILVSILFYIMSRKYIRILRGGIKIDIKKAFKVLKLGAPFTVQRVTFTAIGIVMAKIISEWGATAIAVQKVGLQIESISYMTIGGLHGAMTAFVGQNYGSKDYNRIKEGYKSAVFITVCFGLITTTIFTLFPYEIFSIFLKDPVSIEMGIYYVRIIGFSQVFMCMEIVTNASFSGVGKTQIPSFISIIFTSLRIPLAIFLSRTALGLNGVWWSISITSMIKGTLLVSWFVIYLNTVLRKKLNNITLVT